MNSRNKRIRGHLAILAAVAVGATMSLAGCAPARVPDQALVVGQSSPLAGNFDPYALNVGNNVSMYQLYDSLIRTGEGLKVEPRLAKTWEFSANGLALTLNLRAATFADGTPITSKHVATSLAYVQDAKNGANANALSKRVVGTDVTSDTVVVLKFAAPFPGVFDLLNLLVIVDKGTIDSKFAKPNASGPFKLDSYQPGIGYKLATNTAFWNGAPQLKSIEVKFLDNVTTLVSALKSGDINFIQQVGALEYEALKADKKYTVGLAGGANSVMSLTLNVKDPALSNPTVRLALSRAFNRDRIVKDVMYGSASVACLPFNTPNQLGYDADLAKTCVYDLKEAAKLLADAKVKDLSFSMVTSGQINPALPKIAEIFQADLATIGVKLKIVDVDAAAFREQASGGTFPQALLQIVGRSNVDPDTLFSATNAWKTVKNASRFDNAEYVKLVAEAGSSLDPVVRAKVYRQINELVLKQNFVIPVVTNPKPYAAIAGVKDVTNSSNGQPFLEKASIR